jgi:hypothetical protein
VAGRVVREYVGTGPLAEALAARDEAARLTRAAARAAFREDRGAIGAARSCSAEFDHVVRAVLQSAMAAAGYRWYRSAWRRGHVKPAKKGSKRTNRARAALETDGGECAPSTAELRAFLTGSGATTPPPAGDLALLAEDAWVGLIAGENDPFRAVVVAQLAAFKADLRAGDSPLERLLLGQLAVSFLEATFFSAKAAQTAGAELTHAHRDFLLKGADRAHRRVSYLARQLAVVRGLVGTLRPPTGHTERPQGRTD